MSNRLGMNANRRLVGGDNTNVISPELEKLNTTGHSATLFKAVVTDVILDPYSLTEEEIEAIAQTVNNPELADVMPVNSVIAKIVSNGAGNSSSANTILFPFFQSHMMLPVKVGEMVYVIYEDYGDIGGKVGYWITRIHAQRTIEDTNYTHLDRRFDETMNPSNYSTLDKTKLNDNVTGPDFQNGGGSGDQVTMPVLKKGENPFDTLVKEIKSAKLLKPEPVPRWKKRPGEFVLQGSNNTLLCFGEDRSGDIDNKTDAVGSAGTIDMVVGRGRVMPKDSSEEPKLNAPRVIVNSRGDLETDKAPYRKGFTKKDNPKEGNPDFENDASRLYVSMQTDGDTNFKVKLNPKASLKLPKLPNNGTLGRGFLVGKSDHVRLIARKNTGQNISGTVLLIKEGEPDSDLGYFYINDEGQIQIEGPKIFVGQATGATEPTVLYTNYQETIINLQNQIDTLTKMVESAFGTALGNLGAPIPSLLAVGAAGTITIANTPLKQKVLANTKPDQHSLKTFNEPNPNRK